MACDECGCATCGIEWVSTEDLEREIAERKETDRRAQQVADAISGMSWRELYAVLSKVRGPSLFVVGTGGQLWSGVTRITLEHREQK